RVAFAVIRSARDAAVCFDQEAVPIFAKAARKIGRDLRIMNYRQYLHSCEYSWPDGAPLRIKPYHGTGRKKPKLEARRLGETEGIADRAGVVSTLRRVGGGPGVELAFALDVVGLVIDDDEAAAL